PKALCQGRIVSVTSNRGNTIVAAITTSATITVTLNAASHTGLNHSAMTVRTAAAQNVTATINMPLTCGSTLNVVPKKPNATPMKTMAPASMKTPNRYTRDDGCTNSLPNSSERGETIGRM